MLGYNRTTRTHIKVLLNIGPGAGLGTKKRGKKSNLSNTFDDDCSSKLYHFLTEKRGRYRRVNLPPPYTFSANFSLLPKIGGGQYATPALSRKGSYLTFRASLLHQHTARSLRNHRLSRIRRFLWRKSPGLYLPSIQEKYFILHYKRKTRSNFAVATTYRPMEQPWKQS